VHPWHLPGTFCAGATCTCVGSSIVHIACPLFGQAPGLLLTHSWTVLWLVRSDGEVGGGLVHTVFPPPLQQLEQPNLEGWALLMQHMKPILHISYNCATQREPLANVQPGQGTTSFEKTHGISSAEELGHLLHEGVKYLFPLASQLSCGTEYLQLCLPLLLLFWSIYSLIVC